VWERRRHCFATSTAADGGATVRFVIGAYGDGKTFFAGMVRLIAHEKKCETIMHADLSPNRRIHASGGQGQRALRRGRQQHGHPKQA
jgi:hypothetical protein